MRLAVSNIAWEVSEEPRVLSLLEENDIRGVEVAPTVWWRDWVGATPSAAAQARGRLERRGFVVPALQSVMYGLPKLQVFGAVGVRGAMVSHISRVAELAAELGADTLVFGSPLNRKRGALSKESAMQDAVSLFRQLGDACARFAVALCVEPNPVAYNCDFLTSWREVREFVGMVDHPHVAIHLDIGCIAVAGDSPIEAIVECAPDAGHFHASEPDLAAFTSPTLDHAKAALTLADVVYTRWISLEMRRPAGGFEALRQSISRFRESYAGAAGNSSNIA